ncbi:hypothetical protein Btru_002992 [Bulinus truncatus]|nr:hypothetical protein Btru_002992 [Bulinus truncatus]
MLGREGPCLVCKPTVLLWVCSVKKPRSSKKKHGGCAGCSLASIHWLCDPIGRYGPTDSLVCCPFLGTELDCRHRSLAPY